ncbi:lactate dehydrogenase [Oscillospiraceae bacterium HV4-5-C5C]|nr:lactate dehydrogenase [Oscillospiraceae bacterium HV4-5-C5C]
MKILFYALRPFDELAYCQRFSQQYGIDFDWVGQYPSADNFDRARGCEAVSTIPCDMSAPVLDALYSRGVRYLPCRSIGYDHIDLEHARQLGLRVSNVSYPPTGVAHYAVMLMLMCLRKIEPIMSRARVQDFSLKGKIGRDISQCTVGVIGTGQIGRTVIKSLSGFGCRILCYDLYPNADVKALAQYVSLEDLLAQSDVITLHTNATEENYHLLDASALQRCKDGVVIINTARGKLLDTDALIAGLKSGKIGAAGLDVLEHENGLYYYNLTGEVIENDRMALLRSYPNVILSPHTAFYTETAVEHMVEGVFRSVRSFADGTVCDHEIKLD